MAQDTTSASRGNILILGGSYSGVLTAHYLLRHVLPTLPRTLPYKIIIVSASSQAVCRPACPRALISDAMFPQDKLFANISEALQQYPQEDFRFVHASGGIEQLDFHALVIATGASTPSPLLGLNQGENHLRESWKAFRQALPTATSIVIAGGGPAGVETAGELGEYLNGHAGWFGSRLANPKVSVTIVTAGSDILPALRPALAKKAEGYLAKVGVTVIKNARVKAVIPHGAGTEDVTVKATITLEDGKMMDADLYILTTGTRPNTGFIDKVLLTPDGRVETNTSTLRVDEAGPRIYAIGDVGSYARPAIHLIMNAIPVLCANIKRDLLSASKNEEGLTGQDRIFKEDVRETQMIPIRKSKGVGAAMGYQLPSFMVWLIKGRDYWLWTTGRLWSGKQWARELWGT